MSVYDQLKQKQKGSVYDRIKSEREQTLARTTVTPQSFLKAENEFTGAREDAKEAAKFNAAMLAKGDAIRAAETQREREADLSLTKRFEEDYTPGLVPSRLAASIPSTISGITSAVQGLAGIREQQKQLRGTGLTGGSLSFDPLAQKEIQETVQEPEGKAFETLGKVADVTAEQAEKVRQQYVPSTKFGELAGAAIESAPLSLSTALTGGATAPLMGISTGGQILQQAQREGVTFGEGLQAAIPGGFAETALETMMAGPLDNLVRGKSGVIKSGLTLAGEVGTEVLTEIAQQTAKNVAYADEGITAEQLSDTAITAALMTIMFAGLGQGSARVQEALNRGSATSEDIVEIANEQGIEGNTVQDVIRNADLGLQQAIQGTTQQQVQTEQLGPTVESAPVGPVRSVYEQIKAEEQGVQQSTMPTTGLTPEQWLGIQPEMAQESNVVFKSNLSENQRFESKDLDKVKIPEEYKVNNVLYRSGEKADNITSSPTGEYYSYKHDGESIHTPFKSEGKDIWKIETPQNTLEVEVDPWVEEAMSAGSLAAVELHPLGAEIAQETSVEELRRILTSLNPEINASTYKSNQELLEAIGATLARQQGYDSIRMEREDAEFSEFVALDDSAISEVQPMSIDNQVKSIVENATPETAQQALKQIEELEKKSGGLKMNLQMFGEAKDTLRGLLFDTKTGYTQLEGAEKELAFPKGRVTDLLSEVDQVVNAAPLTYNAITNEGTVNKANELIEKYPEASKELISTPGAYNNPLDTMIGMRVIENMYNDALTNDSLYDEIFRLTEAHAQKLKNAGQQIQTASLWAKSTPEGMVRYIDKMIEDAKKRGYDVTADNDFKRQIYEDMVAIKTMKDQQQGRDIIRRLHEERTGKQLPDAVDRIIQPKSIDELTDLATEQVMQKIVDIVEPTFWKKVGTYQAMAHLLNTKTASRNVLSNLSMNQAERLANILAVPIDSLIARRTGKKTVALPTPTKQLRGAQKAAAQDARLRIELGLPLDGNKYQVGQTFKPGSIFNKPEKALRYELQLTDQWQKGGIQADVEDQFRRLNNGKDLTAEQKAVAEEEARFRTFQDDTLPSTFLSKVRDDLNRFGFGAQRPGTGIDVGGKQMFGVREFGAGDFVLKYSKVPGNIIMRKIEYSPLGYIKALHNFSKMDGSVQSQRDAAMSIGRATTGSAVVGMGVLLRALGLIIRIDDEDKKGKQGLMKAAGLGNYKFNVTGAGRLLSGKDPSLQEGDSLVSYGWIEPIGSSFSIGASIYDSLKNEGTAPEVTMSAINQTLEESLDISTLSIIKSMTYAQEPLDVLAIPFASNVSGFVPSFIRQGANIADPVMRQKYTGTPFEKAAKQTVGTLPLASRTLEPYLSPVGQERTSNTGIGGRLVSQLSPGNVTRYQPSPILEPLTALDEATDKAIPWPSATSPSTLKINGENITLTDRQKTEYMRAKGQYIEQEYIKILSGKDFNTMTERQIEDVVKQLNKVKSDSVDIGKEALGQK